MYVRTCTAVLFSVQRTLFSAPRREPATHRIAPLLKAAAIMQYVIVLRVHEG